MRSSVRMAVSLGALLGVASLGGCSVGKGVGAASGTLFELGCSDDGDYCSAPKVCGTEAIPIAYDLKPTFFAGEPIDDLRQVHPGSAIMSNRITIRLQRSGKRIEQNDVLTFDIASSYEVARCVRGRVKWDPDTKGWVNDWDEANCYREPPANPAEDKAPGRMRVQFDSPVRAALTLKATCTANLVASAVSAEVPSNYTATPNPVVTNGRWDSWVEFQAFGNAGQVDKVPTERDPVANDFRIELGQRLYATAFALTLVDDAVVNAAIKNLPRPASRIGASLGGDPQTGGDPQKGRFDFDLQRGQGAQFFP